MKETNTRPAMKPCFCEHCQLDLLKRRVFETGRQVDALSASLRNERAVREALASCQACFDALKVPIDGYLIRESRDPAKRFTRECHLCVVVERELYQQDVRTVFACQVLTVYGVVIARLPGLFLLALVMGFLILMLIRK